MKFFIPGIKEADLFMRPEETQIQRLSRLANMFGDFKVTYSFKNKDGQYIFTKHTSVLECLETDKGMRLLEKANHRQILPIELVLDVDEKPSLSKLNRICNKLDEFNCIYYAYSTGSRGYHIHIFDYDLNHRQNWRKRERRNYLNELFECDVLKNSERVMIAMENKPHWKTGNKKELIRYGE